MQPIATSFLLSIFLVAVPALAQADSEVSERPEGVSFGFGAGYDLREANLLGPNGASIRFRLNRSFTFEPFVRAISDKRSFERDDDDEVGNNEFDNKLAIRVLEFGTNVRYRLKSRGKVDLIAVGGILGSQSKIDPRGPDNTDKELTIAMEYGFGAEYWFNKNWCLSATGHNPAFSYIKSSSVFDGDSKIDRKEKVVGFSWAPRMDVAFHLYY